MTANASLFCYFCRWRNIHLFESPKLVLRPKLCPLILKITFNSPILDFPLNYLKGLKVYQELKNETIQIRLPGIRQYLWFTCDQQKCQIVLKVYAMKKSHEIMFHILKIRHSTNHDTMYTRTLFSWLLLKCFRSFSCFSLVDRMIITPLWKSDAVTWRDAGRDVTRTRGFHLVSNVGSLCYWRQKGCYTLLI